MESEKEKQNNLIDVFVVRFKCTDLDDGLLQLPFPHLMNGCLSYWFWCCYVLLLLSHTLGVAVI